MANTFFIEITRMVIQFSKSVYIYESRIALNFFFPLVHFSSNNHVINTCVRGNYSNDRKLLINDYKRCAETEQIILSLMITRLLITIIMFIFTNQFTNNNS